MKKTVITLLSGLALATAAQAGPSYSAKGKDVVVTPPAPSCLWTWFAGGSAGYIGGDWKEDIYTLHIGAERTCPGSTASHAIFLEVGYTEKDYNFDEDARRHTASIDVVPITLNYKYENVLTGKLNWYVGAGAGVALVDIDINGPYINGSDDDTAFYAHVFAGLTYNVSESFEIFGGARYIYMDDVFNSNESILDDEVQYELGARFNF